MRKFADIEKEGYKGCDASLETSLFEYGLIWKESEKDITFIFGVNRNASEYTLFDWGTVEKDVDLKKEYDWIEDWNDIFQYTGMTEEEFFANSLTFIVSDLIFYYGYQNVFGDCYYPFKIKVED